MFQSVLLGLLISPILEKIVAIITKGPTKPNNWVNIDKYNKARELFSQEALKYDSQFPGIKEVEYDLSTYGINCIYSMIDKLVSFTNAQNELIRKNNLRQTRQYWFDLDPFDFEKEVAYWFERQGYKSDITKKTGDGGVDIIIYKENYKAYIQCKRYTKSKVDRPTLNAFYGVMCADNIKQGLVVTLLGTTNEAQEFADKVGIKVITIEDLIPKDSIIHNNLLNTNTNQNNNYWIEIGNIKLNTNAYRTRDDVFNKVKNWPNANWYHPIGHNGIYLCIYCNDEIYKRLIEWIEIQSKNTIPYSQKKNQYYRKRRYWRY